MCDALRQNRRLRRGARLVASPTRSSVRDAPLQIDDEGPTVDSVVRMELSLGTFDSRCARDEHQHDHTGAKYYVRCDVVEDQQQPTDHQTEDAEQQSADQGLACRTGRHVSDSTRVPALAT